MILNTAGTVRKSSKLLEEAARIVSGLKCTLGTQLVHTRTTLDQIETLNTIFAQVKICNSTNCQTKHLISKGPDTPLHNFKRLI